MTYELCPNCKGKGSVCGVTGNGMTSSEWDEFTDGGRDYETIEAYNSGAYNKPCPTCKGKRVVTEVEFKELLIEEDDDEQEMWSQLMAQQEGY